MNIKKALIITDVQKDFCPGGSLATNDGNRIVPIINKLQQTYRFDKIIATQDWHPEGHRSFASIYDNHTPFDIIKDKRGIDVLWPDHCVAGTNGAEFHDDLITTNVDLIIRKGHNKQLDSYSTFLENDKKTETGLSGYLKTLEINTIYLCGIASDVCVYYSALDALKYQFKTHVVKDATAGVDMPEGNIEKTETIMREKGVIFVNSENLEPVK